MGLHTWTCQGCGAVVTMQSEPWEDGCVGGRHAWRRVGDTPAPRTVESDAAQFRGFLFWVSLFPVLLVTDVLSSTVLAWMGLASDRAESYGIAIALALCAALVLWRYRGRRRAAAELESLFGPKSVPPKAPPKRKD